MSSKPARSRVRSLVLRTSKSLFATADLFMGPWPGPRLLIYHHITDEPAQEMDLSSVMFASQLDWLLAHGRILALREALELGTGERSHVFVLTFDDGYLSLYERVFPLLRARGVPFTLYLTTGPVEEQEPLAPGYPPLQWDHVTEMAESGLMTIGSHTHHHRQLRGLEVADIDHELAMSDDLIRRRTGLVSRHFAYPKGYWDPTAEQLVRQRYETAVLGAGPPIGPGTDLHRLHRLPIQRSDGMFFFKRKVLRGMRLEEPVRRLVKRYRPAPR